MRVSRIARPHSEASLVQYVGGTTRMANVIFHALSERRIWLLKLPDRMYLFPDGADLFDKLLCHELGLLSKQLDCVCRS